VSYRTTATLAAVMEATDEVTTRRRRQANRHTTRPAWERYGVAFHGRNN
jgi:hypothetical protein